VIGNPYRIPRSFAKMAAHVDNHLRAGAHLRQWERAGRRNEHAPTGWNFDTTRERLEGWNESCGC